MSSIVMKMKISGFQVMSLAYLSLYQPIIPIVWLFTWIKWFARKEVIFLCSPMLRGLTFVGVSFPFIVWVDFVAIAVDYRFMSFISRSVTILPPVMISCCLVDC